MNKKFTIGIIIVTVLLGTTLWEYTALGKGKNLHVKVAEIKMGDIKSYLSTSAVIKSKKIKEYYGLQLRVRKVNVKAGDKVKKGQVLVIYDTADLDNAIRQARLNYSSALLQKKMLEKAKREGSELDNEIIELESQIGDLYSTFSDSSEFQEKLVELKQRRALIKPVTEEQIQQAENAVVIAKIGLDSASGKLKGDSGKILAEFDGVITSVNAVEGGVVNPMLPAVVEMDLSNLKAVVSVGKFDASRLRIGQGAEVKTGAGLIKGKVSFIEPVAKKVVSPTGGDTMLNAEIELLEETQGLKVDFDTDVNILVGEAYNVVKLPSEAIKNDKEDRNFIYIYKDGRAYERSVKLGIQSEMEAEIVEGLKPGEKVILNPPAWIKNGLLVKESEN